MLLTNGSCADFLHVFFETPEDDTSANFFTSGLCSNLESYFDLYGVIGNNGDVDSKAIDTHRNSEMVPS